MRTRLILKGDYLQTTQLEVGRGKSQSKDGSMEGKRETDAARVTTEQKWIQGEETIPSSAMRRAAGLQEWHLKASHVQPDRGKGLMPQSLFGAPRGLTPALGGGK